MYTRIRTVRLTLIQLSPFVAKWSKLRLTDEDLQELEAILLAEPTTGSVIPATGGLRKLRFAPPSWHTGKRGALRVIYAFIAAGDSVYFFTVYGKNERTDMAQDEKKLFREVLGRLQASYQKNRK